MAEFKVQLFKPSGYKKQMKIRLWQKDLLQREFQIKMKKINNKKIILQLRLICAI